MWRTCALLVLLACPATRASAQAPPNQGTLIQTLFGDLPHVDGVDANGDGAVTVADIFLLPPPPLFVGTIEELVPHAVGDQLVYRIIDPDPRVHVGTETTLVVSTDAAGGFVLDDQLVRDQVVRRHEQQSYVDTGTQLFFGGTDMVTVAGLVRTTCNPPLLQLMVPVVAGQTFSTHVQCVVRRVSDGLFIGTVDRTDTFTPIDIVASLTVPAGTYTQLVHIRGTTKQDDQLEIDELYIAPGVGIILQLQTIGEQTTQHELSGGTIGGLPVTRP